MLPLAMPAYVLGFVFLGLFDFTGPLQTFLLRRVWAGRPSAQLRSYWGGSADDDPGVVSLCVSAGPNRLSEPGRGDTETARSLGPGAIAGVSHA